MNIKDKVSVSVVGNSVWVIVESLVYHSVKKSVWISLDNSWSEINNLIKTSTLRALKDYEY